MIALRQGLISLAYGVFVSFIAVALLTVFLGLTVGANSLLVLILAFYVLFILLSLEGDGRAREPHFKLPVYIDYAILALIVAVAVFLRIRNLTNVPLWPDEALVYYVAKSIAVTGIPTLKSGVLYTRGILHEYILAALLNIKSDPIVIMRSLSVLFGVGSVAVTYFLGREIYSRRAGLTAAAVCAVSTWSIIFSRYSRMYMLFELLFLLAIFFFTRVYFGKARTIEHAMFIIVSVLAIFTYELSILLLFFYLFLVFTDFKSIYGSRTRIAALLITLFAFVCQYTMDFFGITMNRINENGTFLAGLLGDFFDASGQYYFSMVNAMFPLALVILFVFVFLVLAQKREPRAKMLFPVYLVAVALIVLTILDFMGTKAQPRYLAFLYPLLALIVSASVFMTVDMLLALWEQKKKTVVKRAAGIVLVIIAIAGILGLVFKNDISPTTSLSVSTVSPGDPTFGNLDISTTNTYYPDYTTTADYFKANWREGDIVISTSEIPLLHEYYLGKHVDYWLRTNYWEDSSYYSANNITTNLYSDSRVLPSLNELKAVLSQRSGGRVWILATPSLYMKIHINDAVRSYLLEENKDKIVYTGSDGKSLVFLFV